ncbi:MAG: hypothetical protein M5U09_11680 [Gammaproteobacteria bacterium]|nr:hypothetical protein [Gammaproteobacteria bacterium]
MPSPSPRHATSRNMSGQEPTKPAAPPYFIEAEEAESLLGGDNVVIVDLTRPEVHAQLHLPGRSPSSTACCSAASSRPSGCCRTSTDSTS